MFGPQPVVKVGPRERGMKSSHDSFRSIYLLHVKSVALRKAEQPLSLQEYVFAAQNCSPTTLRKGHWACQVMFTVKSYPGEAFPFSPPTHFPALVYSGFRSGLLMLLQDAILSFSLLRGLQQTECRACALLNSTVNISVFSTLGLQKHLSPCFCS